MADVADVATIERIAARVAEQIITQVTERLEEQDRRIDDLTTTVRLAAASVTTMLHQLTDQATTRLPGARPAALDAACNADPTSGRQRVTVDVLGHAVTEYVRPGDDPAAVWAAMYTAVATHATEQGAAWHN